MNQGLSNCERPKRATISVGQFSAGQVLQDLADHRRRRTRAQRPGSLPSLFRCRPRARSSAPILTERPIEVHDRHELVAVRLGKADLGGKQLLLGSSTSK